MVKQIKIGPFLVNVCISCGEPVNKASELTYGTLPSARITCRACIKEAIKPAPVDLSSVSTSDLHAELVKRAGVKEIVINVGEELTMTRWEDTCRFEAQHTVTGPARILINED